jgi:hypothetical protein
MNINNQCKQIEELINGLQRLIQSHSNNSESISRIELDLALEKVRRLYDILLQMKIQESKPDYPVSDEITSQVEPVDAAMIPLEEPQSVPENIIAEPEIIDEPVLQEIQQSEEVLAQDVAYKDIEPAIPDLFSGTIVSTARKTDKTVVEKLSEENQAETIADKIGSHKITGLKQAIGINEKFFFINELFQGNMKEYSETLNALDQVEEIQATKDFLENLCRKNSWDTEGNAVRKLYEFIERKFK